MNRLNSIVLVVPLALALSACVATTETTQPPAPTVPVPVTQPPVSTPTPTPSGESGVYRTGEAVGETARDVWETTKEFGRGLWTGFQLDNEEGQ